MNEDRYFFRRNMKFFSGEKFNRELAFTDCQSMYQQENFYEMFTKFYEIFQGLLDQHAPIQICDSSIEQNKKSYKPWISKELKKLIKRKTSFVQSKQIFSKLSFFRQVQEKPLPSEPKLRDAHHKNFAAFVKQFETSKQKWNFINEKLGNHKQGINVSEIETDGAKTVDKKAICNAFNKSFAEMGK